MGRNRKIAIFLGVLAGIILLDLVGVFLWKKKNEVRFDEQIRSAAERYQIDPALIKAVIWQESRFDPDARGKAGEIGLMQVMEEAALEWADAEKVDPFHHEHITDPEKNILAGSFYLAKVMKRYGQTDNPIPYALADYNAGRTHVLRWKKGAAQTNSAAFLEQMDFPGTKQYAIHVMERYDYYKSKFNR